MSALKSTSSYHLNSSYIYPVSMRQFPTPNMHISYKLLLLFSLCFYIAKSVDPLYSICSTNIVSNGSTQSRNINTLLTILVSGTVKNGFTATSYRKGRDQIYGLAQCRGDMSKSDCSRCIQNSAKSIRDACPTQTGARIWYDYCYIRYDTVNFFDQVDTSGIYYYNVANVTDPDVFNKKLGALMNKIDSEAVKPKSKGLGKGESEISPFVTLYALVQCTRDLSALNCAQCLSIAVSNFATICENKRGCRVVYSSCYVRYELYPFFFPLDPNGSSVRNSVEYKSIMVSAP